MTAAAAAAAVGSERRGGGVGGGRGRRLELSDFKWSRDEEISNFPPGCVSVGRCARRCTGTYSSTRINHWCQQQVTEASEASRDAGVPPPPVHDASLDEGGNCRIFTVTECWGDSQRRGSERR